MLKLNRTLRRVREREHLYLNTSYVEVKLISLISCIYIVSHLNTSYVEVKRISVLLQSIRRCDLNTSYVEVKPVLSF